MGVDFESGPPSAFVFSSLWLLFCFDKTEHQRMLLSISSLLPFEKAKERKRVAFSTLLFHVYLQNDDPKGAKMISINPSFRCAALFHHGKHIEKNLRIDRNEAVESRVPHVDTIGAACVSQHVRHVNYHNRKTPFLAVHTINDEMFTLAMRELRDGAFFEVAVDIMFRKGPAPMRPFKPASCDSPLANVS